ncbi:YgfZ/GcvT domain-containing protein [Dyella subtropica]|uniref:CAF17-like 4Fe-4S cluster assembly/insertion protein YgfZ n=1 Tax=Dyella subtropica TaxID=2992127 RepID=UPI00225145CB|nr:folate-binding protein [Dyella subtropica]
MPQHYPAETLLLEGPDAISFAQSQFSSQVDTLADGQWQFSAWLDAQGRVRALFHLARLAPDRLLLLLRGGDAASIADALRRFVFRSKVTVQALPPRTLGTSPARDAYVVDETQTPTFGCGTHSLIVGAHEDDAWRVQQIRMGWPWLPDNALSALLPPALSLERLQGVAFDKGCYPGQEIVARLHYRGGHKRHMHCVVLSQPVSAGSVLREGDQEIAIVLDAVTTDAHGEALAVINDAIEAQATQRLLHANDGNIEMQLRERWPA